MRVKNKLFLMIMIVMIMSLCGSTVLLFGACNTGNSTSNVITPISTNGTGQDDDGYERFDGSAKESRLIEFISLDNIESIEITIDISELCNAKGMRMENYTVPGYNIEKNTKSLYMKEIDLFKIIIKDLIFKNTGDMVRTPQMYEVTIKYTDNTVVCFSRTRMRANGRKMYTFMNDAVTDFFICLDWTKEFPQMSELYGKA